jgi:hypothetical protein
MNYEFCLKLKMVGYDTTSDEAYIITNQGIINRNDNFEPLVRNWNMYTNFVTIPTQGDIDVITWLRLFRQLVVTARNGEINVYRDGDVNPVINRSYIINAEMPPDYETYNPDIMQEVLDEVITRIIQKTI